MAAPIGPGDWVECVRCTAGVDRVIGIRLGGIYRVQRLQDMGVSCRACRKCDQVGIQLDGVDVNVDGFRQNFICSGAFRPIYRPKQTFIDGLKQPAPERECEAA